MSTPLGRAFQNARSSPPEYLASNIVRTIELRRRRSLQLKLSGYAVITLGSLAALVPATIELVTQFSQTGFFRYASVAFSSGGSPSGYWRQFGITLLEALPGASIAIVLGITLALAWSARHVIRNGFALGTVRA